MKKILVAYFSNTGSNRFLAEQFAKRLDADICPIIPRMNVFPFQMLSSFTKISLGIRPLPVHVKDYEAVVLCGPIWAGQLINPMRCFLKRYRHELRDVYFATCCGSRDEIKDDHYGYSNVFKKVYKLIGDKLVDSVAFPIPLALPENQRENDELIMKTRLTEENFNGELLERFDGFVGQMAPVMIGTTV